MSPLFPDATSLALACLIAAVAQVIYATVGFGAGMFAVTALALFISDLAGIVATLFVLTAATEVWILVRDGRRALGRTLASILPGAAIGTVIGTELLAGGSGPALERALGAIVLGAGVIFLVHGERGARTPASSGDGGDGGDGQKNAANGRSPPEAAPDSERALGLSPTRRRPSLGLGGATAAGLASGILGGLFGMSGPPVILWLRAQRVPKDAFRATLIGYFFLTGLVRAGSYIHEGLLTERELVAALWLLPASLAGAAAGISLHGRLSERTFERVVAVLLVALGAVLAAGG